MKFGKEIQAQQIPGWSRYYLDYKFLKKIINSLAQNRPASEAAALAAGIRPSDLPLSADTTSREEQPLINPYIGTPDGDAGMMEPPLWVGGGDESRGAIFKAHRKAFFFKLERELEKINEFYLQKENELRLRLETLLSKQKAAMERSKRNAGNADGEAVADGVEWRSIEEGFRVLQKDLLKLQQFIEINATGFRKILKKWDKRSKSHTKELYLSRQVEVQPCFNRHLLAELSNIVSTALVDLPHAPEHAVLINGDIIHDEDEHRSALERQAEAAYADFESNLSDLVARKDEEGVRTLLPEMDLLLGQAPDAKTHITRILSRAIIEAPPHIADLLITSTPFDFSFEDDISGRTSLHETAIAGEGRLVQMCIDNGVNVDRQDVYGRTALHYASMNGHVRVCEQLLAAHADVAIKDSDNCTQFAPDESQSDKRCLSVGAAVNFAKANNLLGVTLNASLLRRVPSLIRGIKALGVIMAAFGERDDIRVLPTSGPEGSAVDAILQDGVFMYMDNPLPVVV
ncbi:SPX-domain-containing protein [Calocera cornea HHB12733]|uniref:SPX-domain-containing protein n=1 Tax=Calocera cornea HHB12733 TaxID=1353952 RepID=A0A165EBT3_9BASI|nr:SPX-domain-containing protein [Calocera cornea HHB12733]